MVHVPHQTSHTRYLLPVVRTAHQRNTDSDLTVIRGKPQSPPCHSRKSQSCKSRTSDYIHKKEEVHILPCTHSPSNPHLIFLQESQRKRAHNTKPNHKPTRLLHLLVVDHARGIPSQMPQTVERVVRERHGDGELGEGLEGQRPGRKAGGEHGALEVPADGGRDEVEDAEGVEAAGEGDAGDAVERRAVPGDLRLVDAEVGSDGAVQALLCEDLVVGWGGGGMSVGLLWSASGSPGVE